METTPKQLLRHRLLVGVLALGTLGGFGAGFASVHHHCHRRDEMREMATRFCADGIRDARRGERAGALDAAPRGHRERFAREVRAVCAEAYKRTDQREGPAAELREQGRHDHGRRDHGRRDQDRRDQDRRDIPHDHFHR